MKRSLLIAVCVSAVLLVPVTVSAAKPQKCLVVNRSSGGAFDALQAAVDAAAPGDALTLKGTCHTVRGGIRLGKNLTINGKSNNGFGPATVAFEFDGVGRSSVIRIEAGANVTVTGLTITGGAGSFDGGGISVAGTLVLNDSLVSGNSAYAGAGLAVAPTGNATLNRVNLVNNLGLYGAGIENQGMLTVNGSAITDNDATLDGGGIANYNGTASITDSLISGNSGGTGGGIYTSGGSIAITDSSVTGNTACNGGGIYNSGSTLVVTNSVLTPNTDNCGP